MKRNWHLALLGISAAVAAGCGADMDTEMAWDEGQVASVQQAEVLTCPASVAATAATITADKGLVIRDLTVVQDECRTNWNSANLACTTTTKNKWHFWYLMQQMAGTNNPTRFVLRMLESVASWSTPVNGMQLQPRTLIRDKVINPWMNKTNQVNGNSNCVQSLSIDAPANANCNLDPGSTPLRLLAIVNRIDLRSGGSVNNFYGGGNAGEGRFVFGFTNLNGTLVNGRPPRLPTSTLILEYKLPTPQNWNPQQWAQKWRTLGQLSTFGETYNVELQKLTDMFTKSGAIIGAPNNGSAINQVRMNDFDFDQGRTDPFTGQPNVRVWSLREFKLGCLPGQMCGTNDKFLVPSPVAQTPANISNDATPFNYNDSATLQTYMTSNVVAIEDGSHFVPSTINGIPFQGAESTSRSFGTGQAIVWMPANWNVATQTKSRRLFAFSTCNGCHYSETETANMHIAPRNHGVPAGLSGFLGGPISPTSDPSFETFEYDEPARRACEVAWLAAGNSAPLSTTTGRPH